jgi:hypothetical protein
MFGLVFFPEVAKRLFVTEASHLKPAESSRVETNNA